MDAFKKFLQSFSSQFATFWGQQTPMRRMAMIGGIVVLIGIAATALLTRKTEVQEYLFVDLSPEDSQAIIGFLKKENVPDFTVDNKGIKVNSESVMRLRVKLTQEGLPAHGQVGWEKFDSQDFTRTDFEQKIHRLRAIQGEMARTIMAIEGVQTARVHIVMPQGSVFIEDKKDPTCAVYIRTKPGVNLENRQIRGIVHLVSRSVEGLKPDNITVIDQEGRMLTEEKSGDATNQQTKEMLEYQRKIENELQLRIRSLVGKVVGSERVDAKVDTVIDYTREEQTISDIDPDKVVAIAAHTTNQDVNGTGLNPTGIPGSKSNVPGEQEELTMNTSQAKAVRGTEQYNYEVAKSISHKILPVGTIKRISAAVIVDGKQTFKADGSAEEFQARTEDEMKKIEELVKTAIGYKEGRDDVRVHNMLFQLDVLQATALHEEKRETREYLINLAIAAVGAMTLVFFFAFIVRPYFRWFSYDPERKKREKIIEEYKPDLELSGVQNVQIKEDIPFDKMTPQEQVLFLAKHEPQRTVEAIRMLLNPHQSSHP